MPSINVPNLMGYLPSNVVDGNIIRKATIYSKNPTLDDLTSMIKSVITEEIKNIEQQIEDLKKRIEEATKEYEARYKKIVESRYSEENKKELLQTIRDNLDNEVALIESTIKNLTTQYNNVFGSEAYKNRKNLEKSTSDYAKTLYELLNLSNTSAAIIASNTKTILNIVKGIPNEPEQTINALFAIANLAITIINLKNYGIIDKLVKIEETVNRLYEGNVTDYQRELQILKMNINNVAYAISVKEQNIQRIEDLLNTFDIIVLIIDILITVANILLKFLPAGFLTVGVIDSLTGALNTLKKIVSFCYAALDLVRRIIDSLKMDLGIQKARLEAIFSLFEISSVSDEDSSLISIPYKNKISSLAKAFNGLTPEEFGTLMFGGPKSYELGYLKGFDYRGFKFYLKEENNLKFVVKGHKRRYAVAVNQAGKEVIQSDYSFTLEPEVLVEQLKIEIDLKNLVA